VRCQRHEWNDHVVLAAAPAAYDADVTDTMTQIQNTMTSINKCDLRQSKNHIFMSVWCTSFRRRYMKIRELYFRFCDMIKGRVALFVTVSTSGDENAAAPPYNTQVSGTSKDVEGTN
jgi:hypothetical protein